MQASDFESNVYMTFEQFKASQGNENKNFNDYLLAFFKDKAVAYFDKFFQENDQYLGQICRITNDLATIHPQLSNEEIASQFRASVEALEHEPEFQEELIKRWFFSTTNFITNLFLNDEGKLRKKFQKLLIDKEKGRPDLEAVRRELYGHPEDPERILLIGDRIVASAALAASQIICTDEAVLNEQACVDIAMSPKMEATDIRLQSMLRELKYHTSQEILLEDYFLSRIEFHRQQIKFLNAVNDVLPESQRNPNLQRILDNLLNKVILASPTAGTHSYLAVYGELFNGIYENYETILQHRPDLEVELQLFNQLSHDFYLGLQSEQGKNRPGLLEAFAVSLNRLAKSIVENLEEEMTPGPGSRK
jgi:hypothetical protein